MTPSEGGNEAQSEENCSIVTGNCLAKHNLLRCKLNLLIFDIGYQQVIAFHISRTRDTHLFTQY